ncbi:hypothetical protein LCGC14_2851830, partial [marine sediment metagenome]
PGKDNIQHDRPCAAPAKCVDDSGQLRARPGPAADLLQAAVVDIDVNHLVDPPPDQGYRDFIDLKEAAKHTQLTEAYHGPTA